jgi:hypothetical protein
MQAAVVVKNGKGGLNAWLLSLLLLDLLVVSVYVSSGFGWMNNYTIFLCFLTM